MAVGQPPQQPTLNDPLNDVKSWSEHVAEVDKRVYWHNKVTKTSTYDKPECLKCPEERSIPPCRWKQYSKDGKIYYSDGKESTWTVPEEYREWKERVDAAVERRKIALGGAQGSQQKKSETPKANEKATAQFGEGAAAEHVPSQQQVKPTSAKVQVVEEEVVTYASEKEAVAAFKQLLADHEVTSVMKFKDVQDLCSKESRWNACKSVGARKQALSEYQTQKLKAEREEKRLQARKNRDMFFQLLAETTAIDGRTRWRDAQPLLESSRRYKQIEDDREREDYFNEFVVELAKKEKEDLMELKKLVKVSYVEILDDMYSTGKIKRNAIWADVKDEILGRLDSKLNTMDDADKRHMFQDYMIELENRLRQLDKAEEEERRRVLKAFQDEFRKHLMELVADGTISTEVKWRELKPIVSTHPTFVDLLKFIEDSEIAKNNTKNVDEAVGSVPSISSSCKNGPRDVFDEVYADLLKAEREDKRLLQRAFEDGFEIQDRETKTVMVLVNPVNHDSNIDEIKTQLENFVTCTVVTDEDRIHKYKAPISEILSLRLRSFESLFKKFVDEKKEELAAKEKRIRKYEDRYLDLLDDFYYRSDHVGIEWDEAKREMSRHRAYQDLPRDSRKKLFLEHMEELAAELAKKPSTSQEENVLNGSDSKFEEKEEGEIAMESGEEDGAIIPEKKTDVEPSQNSELERGVSPSRDHSRSRSRSLSRSPLVRGRSGSRSMSRSRSRSKSIDNISRESTKRKRHDSRSDVGDDSENDDSGRERKSKKSKREKKDKKDKKSHKHSHKHRSRDSSRERRR